MAPEGTVAAGPPRTPAPDAGAESAAEARILILAPEGRNEAVLSHLLEAAGLVTQRCANAAQLLAELEQGASAVLLTAVSLTPPALAQFQAWLAQQPAWSTLPLIVLVP